MNPNNLVCRTCLGIISEGKVAHNIDEENGLIRNVTNIREMIMFCIPEMDVYISVNPVICESCLEILINVYNFKIRCLRVENAIRLYIQANNVMEGSVVNLNNVVKQQIIEALKQKNWSPEQIKEYVDKHLCTVQGPTTRPNIPPSEHGIQLMTQNFNAPRMMINTNSRPRLPSVFEPIPQSNSVPTLALTAGSNCPRPSPYEEAIWRGNFRPPPPVLSSQGRGYISVSKNLMPPMPKSPSITQQLRDISRMNTPPFNQTPLLLNSLLLLPNSPKPTNAPTPQVQSTPESSFPNIDEVQSAFLNSLQLTSTSNGGRQEAVYVRKTRAKRDPKNPKKSIAHLGTQNLIPAQLEPPFGSIRDPTSSLGTSGDSAKSITRSLSPTSGLMRCNVESLAANESTLRKVRRDKSSKNSNDKTAVDNDCVIILDDDTEPAMQRTEDELLVMNFDENEDRNVSSISKTSRKSMEFAKKVVVKLPMIDSETLKRKLTPEDVIDEIQSKRRKLVVKLGSNLPYLHKDKRLVVKVRREQFLKCNFCKMTVTQENELMEHYMSNHKVCSRCSFKCDRAVVMSQHISTKHKLELVEALKICEERKPEFLCYLCRFTGLSELDLRDHRLRIHIKCKGSGMYHCPYISCTKESPIAFDVVKHIEKFHDKLRQIQCPLCNYTGPNAYLTRKHIETHSLAKVKCHLCAFWCKTAFSLKIHMRRKHPDAEDQNTSGMVFTDDLNEDADHETSYDEDYRVTLETLQSRTQESQPIAPSNESDERPSLDQYEFALPSLSEMLCTQMITEEPSDQEGDCTIVSEQPSESPKERDRRKGGKRIRSKKSKSIPPSDAADDPDDCMIIPQQITTVDLSDDDDTTTNVRKKQKKNQQASGSESDDTVSSSEVIEIEDQNDNDDCVVVSEDVAISANSSENVNDITSSKPPDGNETDTCSEVSGGAKKKSTVPGSETETYSEISVSDILNQNTTSENDTGVVEKEKEKTSTNDDTDKTRSKASDEAEDTATSLQSSSSQDQSDMEKDKQNEETSISKNTDNEVSDATETVSNKSHSTAPENTNRQVNDAQTDSNMPENSPEPDKSQKSTKKSDQNKNSNDLDTSKVSEHENSQKSVEESLIPVTSCPESFLIESSDEESNDCTIVSETTSQESTSTESTESDKNEVSSESSSDDSSKESNSESIQNQLEKETVAEKTVCTASKTTDAQICNEKDSDNSITKSDKNKEKSAASESGSKGDASEETQNQSEKETVMEEAICIPSNKSDTIQISDGEDSELDKNEENSVVSDDKSKQDKLEGTENQKQISNEEDSDENNKSTSKEENSKQPDCDNKRSEKGAQKNPDIELNKEINQQELQEVHSEALDTNKSDVIQILDGEDSELDKNEDRSEKDKSEETQKQTETETIKETVVTQIGNEENLEKPGSDSKHSEKDENVVSVVADSKPENPDIELNKEINQQKFHEVDSEVLSTDPEKELENTEISEMTSDTEKNNLGVSKSTSETENIESSDLPKDVLENENSASEDKVTDTDISEMTSDAGKNNLDVSKSTSETENIECSDLPKDVLENENSASEDKVTDTEKNIQGTSNKSQNIDISDTDSAQKICDVKLVADKKDELESNKNVMLEKIDSDLEKLADEGVDNINFDLEANLDTVEDATQNLMNILEETNNSILDTIYSKEINGAKRNLSEDISANVSSSEASTSENVSEKIKSSNDSEPNQEVLDGKNEVGDKSVIIQEDISDASVSKKLPENVPSQKLLEVEKTVRHGDGSASDRNSEATDDNQGGDISESNNAVAKPSVPEVPVNIDLDSESSRD